MKSFINSVREYHYWLTVPKTNPKIVWVNGKYEVILYYSQFTISRFGGEVVYE